jgi:hypothetical protein
VAGIARQGRPLRLPHAAQGYCRNDAAALTSLALAIGASLAAFALVDALLLRPLPVYQPERLIQLTTLDERDPHENQTFNYPLFERCRQATHGQLDLFGMTNQFPEPVVFASSGGREEKVRLQYASGNALSSLGIRPALGRLLTPTDDLHPGAHPVAVASYNFWMRRFGGRSFGVGTVVQRMGTTAVSNRRRDREGFHGHRAGQRHRSLGADQ